MNKKVVKSLLAALLFTSSAASVQADPSSTKKNFISEANKFVAESCKAPKYGWQKEACEELKDANDEVVEELGDVLEDIDHEFGHIDAHHAHAGEEIQEEYEEVIDEIEDAIEEIPHESVRKGLTSLLSKARKIIEKDYNTATSVDTNENKKEEKKETSEEKKETVAENKQTKEAQKHGIYVSFVTGLEDGELKVNLEVALKAYEDAVEEGDNKAAKEASKVIEDSIKDAKKEETNSSKYQGSIDVEAMTRLIANIDDEEIKVGLELSLEAYKKAVAEGDEANIKAKEEAFKKDLKEAEEKIKEKNGFNNNSNSAKVEKSQVSFRGLFNRLFGWLKNK